MVHHNFKSLFRSFVDASGAYNWDSIVIGAFQLGKLYYDREEYQKLARILKQLQQSCKVSQHSFSSKWRRLLLWLNCAGSRGGGGGFSALCDFGKFYNQLGFFDVFDFALTWVINFSLRGFEEVSAEVDLLYLALPFVVSGHFCQKYVNLGVLA